MDTRVRPNVTNPRVSGPRHDAIKASIERFNDAYDAGFFVECVALMEGLIGDRLESLANQMDEKTNKSYKPVGTTLQRCSAFANQLPNDIAVLLPQIRTWAKKRNAAVHELPKLQPDLCNTFEDRYSKVKETADEGLKLFRKLDNEIRKFRRTLKP